MVSPRGPKTEIRHHRPRESTCGQVSEGWRTSGSTEMWGLVKTSGDRKQWEGTPPPTLFLPPWCLCPWFQGRHGGGCLCVSLLALFQRPLTPSLSDITPAGGLLTSSVWQNLLAPCWNVDQAHLDSSDGVTLHHFGHDVMLGWPGSCWISALSSIISRSGRENPGRFNSWWLLLGSCGKQAIWGGSRKYWVKRVFWFICAFPSPTLSQLHSDSCVWGLGSYSRLGGQNRRLLPCSSKLPGFQCYPPGCVLLTLAHAFQKTRLWSWRQHVIDVKNVRKKVYICSLGDSFGRKGDALTFWDFWDLEKDV